MSERYLGVSIPSTPKAVGTVIFGSPKRLSTGLYVVGRDSEEPFSIREASEAISGKENESNAGVGGFLRVFNQLGMLERLEEPDRYDQRYVKEEHPLWQIFEAASVALEQSADETNR
jgi:hypothetical protein